jgi:integrase
MLLLSYDGALRPSELVAIRLEDIDFPKRQIRLRDEDAKRGSGRVVGFSALTERFLVAYMRYRRELSPERGPLFLSEPRRNLGRPLTTSPWSKVVRPVADSVGLRQFTPHTVRHLRLTHMARAGLEIHEIASYAGHRSLRSTGIYLHMSGAEIAEKVMRATAEFGTGYMGGYTTGSGAENAAKDKSGAEENREEQSVEGDGNDDSGNSGFGPRGAG